MRAHLFISHSNPEDNDFALWLSLRLTAVGYRVWCDLTRLLGGEDFWQDIEHTIRARTAKFLYVLSRSSNTKPGPLQELQTAHNVMRSSNMQDFIIPLLVDALPHGDMNIQLGRLNAISFNSGWADGLRQLLGKLELDRIPCDADAGPGAVAEWWSRERFPSSSVRSSPEDYMTNWCGANAVPDVVRVHTIKRRGIGLLTVPSDLSYPSLQLGQYLLSFASASDLSPLLAPLVEIAETTDITVESLLTGTPLPFTKHKRDSRNLLVRVLDAAWLLRIRTLNLPTYELSDGAPFAFFPLGFAEGDKVSFPTLGGRTTWRGLVGFKTRRLPDGQRTKSYWHFGIRAKPFLSPFLGYSMRSHVIFTDDGRTPWSSKARLHSARRTWCKDWWNADWRDRILAALEWLSGGKDSIEIPLASDSILQVAKRPMMVTSPVSYSDPVSSQSGQGETAEEELEEDYEEDLDDLDEGIGLHE